VTVSTTIVGIVSNGVVIPRSPLPEGACVEIRLRTEPTVPVELQDEFDAWERAGAGTLEMIEQLASEMKANEKG
jgi:hypothetical protein